MIPLEKQVTSLELSKRLKESGVKQDGLYSYFQYDKWNVLLRETKEIFAPNNECGCNKDNLICSAFTVTEHGIALPRTIQWHNLEHTLSYLIDDYRHKGFLHRVHYKHGTNGISSGGLKTEANARAKMRIYLIENKLVEVKQE